MRQFLKKSRQGFIHVLIAQTLELNFMFAVSIILLCLLFLAEVTRCLYLAFLSTRGTQREHLKAKYLPRVFPGHLVAFLRDIFVC